MAGFKYIDGAVVGRSGTSGDAWFSGGYVTGDHTVHGRALYIGTGGHVGLQTVSGLDIQLQSVPTGTFIEIAHQKIYGATAGPTGPRTTAQGIVSFT